MSVMTDTICAVATPPGKGGVSVIRISGPDTVSIAVKILQFSPTPRHAHYAPFFDAESELIDKGICLYFPGPDSFTGEDVIEFHAHGGLFVVDSLLGQIIGFGARIARPGEFSERAFLNNKLDLAQAEAIADLIDSNSAQAARFAIKSLQGEFSDLIHVLVNSITELRVYIEAAIDFPEEEIDFLSSGNVRERLAEIKTKLDHVLSQARQGNIMKEGLTIVIAGEPNAGKSSLLNVLSGQPSAIVTNIPGTTRDVLKEHITIDGIPLHIIDTAGLRDSDDPVEQEGIKRAWAEVKKADLILLIEDASQHRDIRQSALWQQLNASLPNLDNLILIKNKVDLTKEQARLDHSDANNLSTVFISAKEKTGIDLLKAELKQKAGFKSSEEGGFIARRRHLDALNRASSALLAADEQLSLHKAGELVAEDLRRAQNYLSEITGEFTSDDLLGEIFSSFCIGK